MSKAGRHELEGGCTVQPPSNVQSEHAGKLAKLGHLTQAEASTANWRGGLNGSPSPTFSRTYPPLAFSRSTQAGYPNRDTWPKPKASTTSWRGVVRYTPPAFSRGNHDHGHPTIPGKLAKPGHLGKAEGEHHELERRGLNGSTPLRESTSYRPIDA